MGKTIASIIAALFIAGSWTGVAMSADLVTRLAQNSQLQKAASIEIMRAQGMVKGYEQGKDIQISSSGILRTFNIVSATKVSGRIQKGSWVVVIYEEKEGALVATQISTGAR